MDAIDAASQSSDWTHALTHQQNSLFDSHGDAMTIAFRLLMKINSTDRMIAVQFIASMVIMR